MLKRPPTTLTITAEDVAAYEDRTARRLMQRGVSVVAWLLLPVEAGYWFNLQNYPQAIARYGEFRAWVEREALEFGSLS